MPPKNDDGPGNTAATPQAILIPELLRKILLFANHATLHSCIQVNSTFYEVAGRLLYREVRINRRGLFSFSSAPLGISEKSNNDDAVSQCNRTSQLELLKHIEVLELEERARCWTEFPPHKLAVLAAFGQAKIVRLHITGIKQLWEKWFCPDCRSGNSGPLSASKRCCILESIKPESLVICPDMCSASSSVSPASSVPQRLVADLATVKRIVLLFTMTRQSETKGAMIVHFVRQWVPQEWSGNLEVHFACHDLFSAKWPNNEPAEPHYLPVRTLAAYIAKCLDNATCPIDIVYSSDGGPRSRFYDGQDPVSSGAQVKDYLRRYYPRFFRRSPDRLGRIMTKTEYITSGRKHEIPEDIVMHWAEKQGTRKGKRAAPQAKNSRGWTRGGDNKRQRV